jgi:hypothetical protein
MKASFRRPYRHAKGEVHVEGVTGSGDISVGTGLLSMMLPQDGGYEIDARTEVGDIESDFGGNKHRRVWGTGHTFLNPAAAGKSRLLLRVGYGDIVLLKPAALARGARSGS